MGGRRPRHERATRARTLAAATADPAAITGAALGLLDAAMPLVARRGVTLVGLTVTNLDGARGAEQLVLPLDG